MGRKWLGPDPSADQDLATKEYVDDAVTGLSGGGGMGGCQVFTSSGTFTVPAGATKVYVTMCGGGGGGGYETGGAASGGGGSGGCVLFQPITVTPSANISVTVGAGGSGQSAVETSGTASSFGGYLTCGGGGSGNDATAGSKGTVTGSSMNCGEDGMPPSGIWPGRGGSTPLGSGGIGMCAAADNAVHYGLDGSGYGAGGSGGSSPYSSNTDARGGYGAPGICIVMW